MPLFIKSALTAATRNPGETSDAIVLYKTIPPEQLGNSNALIELCKSFLSDAGIGYKASSDQFMSDGSINLGYLYSEFTYADGYASLDKNTSFLEPLEDGTNQFIDTSVKVGQFLFSDNIQSLEAENEATYSFEARVYECVYLNKYYYNLADKKCFAQHSMESIVPTVDSIYVNYSPAKIVSCYFTPSSNGGGVPFIKNVVFISPDQLEYQEDLSSNFYQTGGQYYADSNLNPLYLSLIETFFPFITLKRSEIIHGPVYSSLNSTNDPIEFNSANYVSIDPFDFQEPILPIISCRISDDGTRDGFAIITYNGETEYVYDTRICGEVARTRFLSIKPLDESAMYLYKNFTTITTYLADVYAYNFRYIDYKYLVGNTDTYSLFKDNGSVATQTVKYVSEQIDFSKYGSVKETPSLGVEAINISFLVYQTSRTEAAALLYELLIPINVLAPQVLPIEILGDKAIITTNYATNLIYYFGEDSSSAQTVSITDSADGQNQKTSISILNKTGRLNVRAYNYFYTLDISDESKALYITETSTADLGVSTSIPNLSIQIRTGSPLTSQNIYDVSSGTSVTTLSFTTCLQNSFSAYYLLANYSINIPFTFLLNFTLNSGDTSLDLIIGTITNRLQSGVGVVISREDLFSVINENGEVDLVLVLNDSTQFKIPFAFKNISSNAPQITSVTTPTLNLDGSGGASLSFSISHKYSRKIKYVVKNSDQSTLLEVTLPRKDYSTLQPYFSSGSTDTDSIETEIFPVGDNATSLYVQAIATNIDSSGNESSQVTLSSSSVSLVKRLSQTTPAIFKFYTDITKTTAATQVVKGQTYYAFLQLVDLAGSEIVIGNYGDYIDTSTLEVVAVESQGDNIDLKSVSVNDEGNYLYSINIGSDSPFDDTAFSIKATFNSLID